MKLLDMSDKQLSNLYDEKQTELEKLHRAMSAIIGLDRDSFTTRDDIKRYEYYQSRASRIVKDMMYIDKLIQDN